jgi:hypothetical protein
MSTIKANAILDASGGNTTTINGTTPTAYNTMGKNKIINGAMDIWQRGTSLTSSSNQAYGFADRWMTNIAGTATWSQSADVPSSGFKYSLSVAGTSATYAGIVQRIESNNCSDLSGQSVTVSFWAKQSVGSSGIAMALHHANSADAFGSVTSIGSTTFTLTSSWAKYSYTFTNLPSGSLNGLQLTIYVNAASATDTILYTGVQLEIGSVATEFERRPYGLELALCQRYYHKAVGTNQMIGDAGIVPAGGYAYRMGYQFPVEMRTTPSFSYDSISFWDGQAVVTNVNLTSSFTNYQRFDSDWTSNTGLTTGRPVKFYTGGGTGYLAFSAEL